VSIAFFRTRVKVPGDGRRFSAATSDWSRMILVNRIVASLMALPISLTGAAADYAGADACRSCHAAEFKMQSASSHARALARSSHAQPGDWAFGAGDQAITFVSRIDAGHYREEGRSWYRQTNDLGPTPGAATPAGTTYRIFDPSGAILNCFSCHSTGPLALAADESLAPHELGVRCEDCHGPAAAHARSPAAEHPQNPGRLTAERLNDFCGSCHRMPLRGNETLDFRDAWNVRHQPPSLAASACFRESRGKLSCLTCHSPHAQIERNPAAYDARCRKCHAAPKHNVAVGAGACIGCHMPRVRPTPYLSFSNHRIAIYSTSDPLLPVRAAR